jgi:hypothetical protein
MTDDDVTWARAVLGPANPVPTGPPPPPLLASPAQLRARRSRPRAVVVGAVGAAAALVAAVVVASALTGGRGHGGAPTSTHAVFAAAAATEGAKTADISVSATTAAGSVSAQGAADLTNGDATFTVTLPASLGTTEVESTGGAVYVQVPSALTAFTGGKPWARLSAPATASGAPVGFDATWLLNWLKSIAGPVTIVGTGQTVHGDATTEYSTTIDLSKVAANAPADLQPYTSQTVPVHLWIDGANRLRELTASFDASGTPAASLGSTSVTVELWGFGTPVQVTAPPADQVGDATSLLPAARRLLPGLLGLPGGATTGSAPANTPGGALDGPGASA